MGQFSVGRQYSPYRFEISHRQCVVKSTNLDTKLGVGGKLFSSFCCNQNCSEVLIPVILL